MAVEQSVAQMALTRDTGPGGFMERLTAVMANVAGSILSEAASTAYHQQRAFYAQKVIADPRQAATQAGPQVVMGPNVIPKTTYDEATQAATCTATDLELQSQVQTFWNSYAAIDAPS